VKRLTMIKRRIRQHLKNEVELIKAIEELKCSLEESNELADYIVETAREVYPSRFIHLMMAIVKGIREKKAEKEVT